MNCGGWVDNFRTFDSRNFFWVPSPAKKNKLFICDSKCQQTTSLATCCWKGKCQWTWHLFSGCHLEDGFVSPLFMGNTWLSSCVKVSFCQDGMSLHRAFSSTQSGKTRAPDGKVCPSLPMIGNFLLYMHLWSLFWFWLMWERTWQLYNINKHCQRHNGPKANIEWIDNI